MNAERYDIAIIGGGLVGASLALALAPSGLRVFLIEAQAPAADTAATWDERCIALNAGSQAIFERLGVWPRLAPQTAAILATHISEAGRFGVARFTADEAGVPALGYNTPMRVLGAELLNALPAIPQLRTLWPARLESLQPGAERVRLAITQGGDALEIEARLVVAADGARSAVRERLGIAADTRDYRQSAVVTAVRPQRPHGGVAYERFLPAGPLAVLPKPDDAQGHACSLVWTVATEDSAAMLQWSDEEFLAQAQRAFGERLGRLLSVGRRQAYPLTRVVSDSLHAPRVVLIGNAAQSLHPVAAQGFNLGLRDVATLAERLAGASDPGAPELLADYAARRAHDRDRVSGFTDRLVRTFSNRLPGLKALRHLGLLALDLTPPVKQAVMRQNLGLSG